MDITDQFLSIVNSVRQIEIESLDDSVFSSKYGLDANDMVYILRFASGQMGFAITEDLIDFLEEHNSFRDVIGYIGSHLKEKGGKQR